MWISRLARPFIQSRLPAARFLPVLCRHYGDTVKQPQLVYRTMQKEDEKLVTSFLGQEFFRKEPICKILGTLSPREIHSLMDPIFPHIFQDGVSVLAECNETGEIFGTILSFLETRNSTGLDALTDDSVDSKKVRVILRILGNLTDGIDLFSKYDVDKSLHIFMCSVKKTQEGHGLGKILVTESEERGRQQGAQIAFAEATSLRSRILLEHLKYDVLKSLPYTIKQSEGAEEEGGDIFCSFCVKRLDDM